jgi:hypothetical protein
MDTNPTFNGDQASGEDRQLDKNEAMNEAAGISYDESHLILTRALKAGRPDAKVPTPFLGRKNASAPLWLVVCERLSDHDGEDLVRKITKLIGDEAASGNKEARGIVDQLAMGYADQNSGGFYF